MNRRIGSLLLCLVVWLALGASCAGSRTIEMRFLEGTAARYVHNVQSEITTIMMGMPIQGTQTLRIQLEQKSLGTDSYGNWRVEQRVKRIQMSMTTGPLSFSFDTEKLGGDAAQFSHILKVITEHPLTVVVNPAGDLVRVEGVEEMQQAIQNTPPPPSTPDANVGLYLGSLVDESLPKSLARISLIPLPPESVAVGDSWERPRSFAYPRMGNVDVAETLTLESVEHGIARIRAEPRIREGQTEGGKFTLPGGRGEMTLRETKMKGMYLFDLKAGQLVRQEVQSEFALVLSDPVFGEVPLSLKSEATTDLVR